MAFSLKTDFHVSESKAQSTTSKKIGAILGDTPG
jgi:hypothetical protein